VARAAVFLDRDGTLNVPPPLPDYITDASGLVMIEGAAAAAARLKAAGFALVVVTNQGCVSKGLVTRETLEEIHSKLRAMMAAERAEPDLILYCPHTSEEGCDCKKPKPGMLLEAARRLGLDLARSWMVGDSPADMAAGRAAGCRTILVLEGAYPERVTQARAERPDCVAPTLAKAAEFILSAPRLPSPHGA
jgi:histidinol-phosphate phosphatase family protein